MILCPSMMCVSYTNLGEEVRVLEEAGTDISHYDIIDGGFVSNTPMGLMDVEAVHTLTEKMMSIHLMIDYPADKIGWLLDAGTDLIYIHPESEPQVMKTLMYIHSRGGLSGLTVNPDTSLNAVKELLLHCDYLSAMSMFSDSTGQTFTDSVSMKIRELITCKKMYGCHIIPDGACFPAVIQEYHALSVDGFVLGTSALFHGEGSYVENMNLLRSL